MINQKVFEYLKHYLKHYGVSGLSLVGFIFLVLSLATFNPIDQSIFYHASHGVCNNFFGYFGASTSAMLIYIFGSTAYLFLGFLAYLNLFLFRKKSIVESADRVVGFLFLIVSAAMISNLKEIGFYEFSSFGGYVGQFLVSVTSYFDVAAQTVIAFSFLFSSSILLLRFSHLFVGRWILKCSSAITFYLLQLDNLPAKIVRGTATMIAKFCYAIQTSFFYIVDLLNGSLIQKSGESIVDFEREDEADQSIDQLMQDVFGEDQAEGLKTEQDSFDGAHFHEEDVEWGDSDDDRFLSDGLTEEEKTFVQKKQSTGEIKVERAYELPDIEIMLSQGDSNSMQNNKVDTEALEEQSAILEAKLAQFGIKGSVVRVHPGPVITMFEYNPESNIKLSKILALEDDLAMALQAISIRILAPIPGKNVVGFEVANKSRKPVLVSDLFHSKQWTGFDGYLPMILGEDTHGDHIVVDLASMPHVLIAGSTGSGKSVAMNCMLVSLLCAKSPKQVKFIIIDPKQLEFAMYDDIAHLLFPIVTDPKKAVPVLRWLVSKMEERYEMMAEYSVRNIFEYQKLAASNKSMEEMPFIVLIIDELADLMMTTGKDIEDLIARIAQMSRAAGIHMIVATQRPSVDVITGLIKVNFPNRISFKVTSKVDSRTILDVVGAERLLGKGDMLFIDSKNPEIKRVHGAFISNEEIEFLVNHIKSQQDVDYLDLVEVAAPGSENMNLIFETDKELYRTVVDVLEEYDEVSISMIQRKFRIGYNRSARFMEALEKDGLILPSDGRKMRKVVK